VALVSFDDPFWAALVDPALTVVAQPVQAMADAAVALLLERMHTPESSPRRVVFDLELRVRASCGSPTGTRSD
jgi:LacI family fructose operon transcriptional repressor